MADRTPHRLCVSHSPWTGPIFAGRGWVISGRLARRFGSRYGTNAKSLRGVIGPISTPNDYLTTVLNDAWELQKHFPPTTVPMVKALTCCNSLPSAVPSCEKSFLTRKEYAICRSPRQIESNIFTCIVGRTLNAISDRNKTATCFASSRKHLKKVFLFDFYLILFIFLFWIL